MDQTSELTLEEEFCLRSFNDQVQRMSLEQAHALLILQHRHMMVQKKMYHEILKHEWKLDTNFTSF